MIRNAPAPTRTRDYYLPLRNRYTPKRRKIIFILDPRQPRANTFMTRRELFRAMMKDVLEIVPSSKADGLAKFAAAGFLIIDATYTPVNRLKGKARNDAIKNDCSVLIADLKQYTQPETSVVLVKANVCHLLEIKLIQAGFDVLNHGERIPFPASGQQGKFRTAIRHVLSSEALHASDTRHRPVGSR